MDANQSANNDDLILCFVCTGRVRAVSWAKWTASSCSSRTTSWRLRLCVDLLTSSHLKKTRGNFKNQFTISTVLSWLVFISYVLVFHLMLFINIIIISIIRYYSYPTFTTTFTTTWLFLLLLWYVQLHNSFNRFIHISFQRLWIYQILRLKPLKQIFDIVGTI